MRSYLQIALPVGLGVWFLVAMVLRSWLVYRRTGKNPIVLPKDDSAHGYIGRLFRFVIAGITLDVAAFAFSEKAYSRLGRLEWAESDIGMIAGLAVLVLSTVIMVIAQAQMGDSWRVGIDAENHTDLVERGLYRRTRNPIYVGMFGALLCLVLCIPNALTMVCAGVGYVLIQVQTRLEEEHLGRLHGAAYEAYRRRVPRWV